MTPAIERYHWSDLSNAPEKPGVYAWYYSPELTQFDVERTIEQLQKLGVNQKAEAAALVRSVLDDRVFRYFREDDYHARIEGPLKPSYEGDLRHSFAPSEGLIARLVADPQRLRFVKGVLEVSAPMFASPIYIGMSDCLRDRLRQHKAMIERYRAGRPDNGGSAFAFQVAKRRMPPERLFVLTCVMPNSEDMAVDVENVLNRIYYPILGRN
jgi:hypothetical protein